MTTRIKRGDIAHVTSGGDRLAAIRRDQRQWPTRRTPRAYTQDEMRTRRRAAHRVAYTGAFDLAAEVEGILGPVAADLAQEPCRGSYLDAVEAIAGAVHTLVTSVAGTVVSRDAREKVNALAPADRERARAALVGLARSNRPTITRADVLDGSWTAALIESAAPYARPLADALGTVAKTVDGEPSSLSDALVSELKDLDRAVLSLGRRIHRAKTYREQNPRPTTQPVEDEAEAHRNTLHQLGIDA